MSSHTHSITCIKCSKEQAAMVFPAQETLLYKQSIGLRCKNCGEWTCGVCRNELFKTTFWSGWRKALCPKCGQPIGPGMVAYGVGTTEEIIKSELVPFGGNMPSSIGPEGITQLTATPQGVTDLPSVYKPSDKTTLLAIILLLVAASVLSPILGWLVIYLDKVASAVGSAMSGGEDNGMLMLIFFAVYMVIAISIGWISALVMTKVARLGKNRNSWISASAAGLAGMGGAIMFLQMRMGDLGVEAFDSNIDRLKALVYVLGMIISSFQLAYMWSKNQFFCEKCMKYMDLSFTRNFKVCHEDDLIKAMDDLQYEDILALPGEHLEKQEDTVNINIHTCDKCLDGIAELTTTRYSFIDHNKPESGKKSAVNRVASKRLPPMQAERVIRYNHANSKG